MKVAIVTDWFAPRRGGIESQLLQLATGLSARGHDVHVVTSTPGPDQVEGCRVHRLPGSLPLLDAALSPRMVRALRDNLDGTYDVVHAHVSVVSPVAYTAALRAAALGLPAVLTFHSVLRLKRYVLRAAIGLGGFATNGSIWTAVSEQVAAQLRAAIDGEVAVLPNGIDATFWRPGRRADGDELIFVSAMRLHAKKRPRELVRAFIAAARATDQPVRLRVLGDGPARAGIEREVAESGLPGNAHVDVLGWLPATGVRAEYECAHAFVLASRREAFGIAALEATAMGLPVIAMTESGSREFIRHDIDGILCRDDEALVMALRRFIGDAALRDRLATRPRDLRRYHWPAVLDAHERVYAQAIARSPGRSAAAR